MRSTIITGRRKNNVVFISRAFFDNHFIATVVFALLQNVLELPSQMRPRPSAKTTSDDDWAEQVLPLNLLRGPDLPSGADQQVRSDRSTSQYGS